MTNVDRRAFLAQSAGALAAMTILPDILPAAPILRGAPLAVGIVGAGRQGRAILGELQKMDAVRVAAVCDTDQSRLDSGVRRASGAEGFADYRQMLEKKPDLGAIFIATPTHQHKEIAVDALGAGKHVYCETPLAHTIEDCRAIALAARNAKGVFHSALEGRSNPIYKLARTFFRSDSVRDLISMRGQHHQKTSWRAAASDSARERALNWRLDPAVSVGLPGELGTHQFDVFNWYRSEYPTTIRAGGGVRFYKDGREVADTAHCDLEYADGVRLQYMTTLANSFEGRHEVFHGSSASIKLAWSHGWMFKEADAATQGWEVYANRQQFHNDEGITLIAEATKLASQGKLKEGVGLPHPPAYYAIADFLKSALDGAPVVSSAEEGLRATAIGILANQALVTGRTIVVDPDMLKAS